MKVNLLKKPRKAEKGGIFKRKERECEVGTSFSQGFNEPNSLFVGS
jgi:hypothetical protein